MDEPSALTQNAGAAVLQHRVRADCRFAETAHSGEGNATGDTYRSADRLPALVLHSPTTAPLAAVCRLRMTRRKRDGYAAYSYRDGQIRTGDPLLPKQVRYQAAPRPVRQA